MHDTAKHAKDATKSATLMSQFTKPDLKGSCWSYSYHLKSFKTSALTWYMKSWLLSNPWKGPIIVWSSDLQALALKGDSIKCHGLGSFVYRTELFKWVKHNIFIEYICYIHIEYIYLFTIKSEMKTGLTSKNAKFLSWLICTASTGLLGAWERPASLIWALKNSAMDSWKHRWRPGKLFRHSGEKRRHSRVHSQC